MTMIRVYVTKPGPNDGGNWQLLAKHPAGSGIKPLRKTSKTTDRAEAEARAREWETILNAVAGELPPDPTALEVLERHIAAREIDGTPAGTVTTYRTALGRLRAQLEDVRASRLDGPTVAQLRDALALRLDGKTVNVTLSRLRTAWRWAIEQGHVTAPWPDVRGAKATRTRKRPMRPREVARLLRWAATYRGGRWLPVFSLLVDTGARCGDVLALDGRHVDRERRRVWVREQKTRTEHWAGVTARTMALLPEVAPDAPLFSGQRGRIKANTVLVVFRRAVDVDLVLEEAERLDVHSLRRTNAKEADRNQVSMGLAMKQTGHQHPGVHMGYQRDPDDDEDMAAVADQIATRWTRELEAADPAPNPAPKEASFGAKPSGASGLSGSSPITERYRGSRSSCASRSVGRDSSRDAR